jgi:hypothetical protein
VLLTSDGLFSKCRAKEEKLSPASRRLANSEPSLAQLSTANFILHEMGFAQKLFALKFVNLGLLLAAERKFGA